MSETSPDTNNVANNPAWATPLLSDQAQRIAYWIIERGNKGSLYFPKRYNLIMFQARRKYPLTDLSEMNPHWKE